MKVTDAIRIFTVVHFRDKGQFTTADVVTVLMEYSDRDSHAEYILKKVGDKSMSSIVSSSLKSWCNTQRLILGCRLTLFQVAPNTTVKWQLTENAEVPSSKPSKSPYDYEIEVLAVKDNGDLLLRVEGCLYKAVEMKEW
jgi:hypothetical protein